MQRVLPHSFPDQKPPRNRVTVSSLRKNKITDFIYCLLLSHLIFHLWYVISNKVINRAYYIGHHICGILLSILYLFYEKKERYWLFLVILIGEIPNTWAPIVAILKCTNRRYTKLHQLC